MCGWTYVRHLKQQGSEAAVKSALGTESNS